MKRFALIGYPLGHTMSPPIHKKLFALSGVKGSYEAVAIEPERFEEALPYLCNAAQSAKGAQKNRINFLLGQVYARQGNNALAYEAFREAGSGSSTLYRTKFNARIKQSEVYTGENIQKEVKNL